MDENGDDKKAPAVKTKRNLPRKYITKERQRLPARVEAHVINQHLRGIRNCEIAREVGIAKSSVTQILKRFAPVFKDLPQVPDFQKVKADIVDSALLRTLKSAVSEKKHEDARLGEVAKLLDVLHKASRLERNQSTQNVSTFTEIRLPGAASNPLELEVPSHDD